MVVDPVLAAPDDERRRYLASGPYRRTGPAAVWLAITISVRVGDPEMLGVACHALARAELDFEAIAVDEDLALAEHRRRPTVAVEHQVADSHLAHSREAARRRQRGI